jgi:phage-related protein
MNSQNILENLAKLESNLQNIDSARKQVETLSNSYAATEKQLKNVALEITSIATDLNVIFNTLKSNNEHLSKEIDNKVDNVIQTLISKITGIQTETDSIKKKFNKDCTSITNQLQSDINSSLDAIQNGVSGILSILTVKVNEEIEKMLLTIQSFQKVVANTLENYEASMESISSKFADDMKVHIASFDKVKQDFDSIVDTLKNQYQLLLNNVSQEVAKINSDIKEYGVKLNTNIENKFESVSTLLNLNSSKLDDISNKITCEFESVTDAIKNVDASQQKYLTSKFSGIDSKADLGLNELNLIKKEIDSATNKMSKDIGLNRKLIILLIVVVLFSLLFNIVTFVI